MAIVVDISSDDDVKNLVELAEQVLVGVLELLKQENLTVSVLLTDDQEMRAFNEQYRGKDSSTDVLSFSMREGIEFPQSYLTEGELESLGDIVISLECAERQALEQEISLEQELTYLLVHGCLHLLGYEHENVEQDEAERMYAKEQEVLEFLKTNSLSF